MIIVFFLFVFFFSDPIGSTSLYGPDHSQTVAAAAVTIAPIVFVTPSFLMEIIILLYRRRTNEKKKQRMKRKKEKEIIGNKRLWIGKKNDKSHGKSLAL